MGMESGRWAGERAGFGGDGAWSVEEGKGKGVEGPDRGGSVLMGEDRD